MVNNIKKYFILRRKNILDYLNLLGIIFFSIVIISVTISHHSYLPKEQLYVINFFILYNLLTFNANKIDYLTQNSYLVLFQVKKYYLLRYLISLILYTYTLQVLFGLCFIIISYVVFKQVILIVIVVWLALLFYLSLVLSNVSKVVQKMTTIVVYYCLYSNKFSMLFLLLLSATFVLAFDFFHKPKIKSIRWKKENFPKIACVSPNSLGNVLILHMKNNVGLLVSLAILSMFGGYVFQKYTGGYILKLPLLMLVHVLYLTILEVFIGNKKEEILVDKARSELFFLNGLSPTKTFYASTLFCMSSLIFYINFFLVLGVLVTNISWKLVIAHLILLPFAYFIGIVYHKKIYLLIADYRGKLIKCTLIILYFISVLLALGVFL